LGAPRKRILIVDDDVSFRETLTEVLETLSYDVRSAENGLVAKTIFDLNPDSFELVLSDIRMPEMDGVALVKHIRDRDQNVKVILMTGFADLIEANEAYQYGVNEFLAKPFGRFHLERAIANCYRPREEAAKQDRKNAVRYCSIPVEEFITGSRLLVDIYVRLSSEKFIKIAHEGEAVPVERLMTYKQKRVDYF
jgi:DNA-binding NtrC family response regulator